MREMPLGICRGCAAPITLAHCSRSALAQIQHVAMAMHAPTNEVAGDNFGNLDDFDDEQAISASLGCFTGMSKTLVSGFCFRFYPERRLQKEILHY